MKKQFLISTSHDVYVDDYNEGELDHVNSYGLESKIKADTWQQAVNKYFEEVLYLSLGIESCEVEEFNIFITTCLVNELNLHPSDYEVKQWEEGKKELYSNTIRIKVYEINEVNLKKGNDGK